MRAIYNFECRIYTKLAGFLTYVMDDVLRTDIYSFRPRKYLRRSVLEKNFCQKLRIKRTLSGTMEKEIPQRADFSSLEERREEVKQRKERNKVQVKQREEGN